MMISTCSVEASCVPGNAGDFFPVPRRDGEWRSPARNPSPAILAGLAPYGFGTLLWLNVLAKTKLSQAYAFVRLGYVLTAVLGYFLFDDAFG